MNLFHLITFMAFMVTFATLFLTFISESETHLDLFTNTFVCVCVSVILFFRRFCLFLQILDKVNVPTTDNIYLHIWTIEWKKKSFFFTIAFENEFFFRFDSSFCFPLFLSSDLLCCRCHFFNVFVLIDYWPRACGVHSHSDPFAYWTFSFNIHSFFLFLFGIWCICQCLCRANW